MVENPPKIPALYPSEFPNFVSWERKKPRGIKLQLVVSRMCLYEVWWKISSDKCDKL